MSQDNEPKRGHALAQRVRAQLDKQSQSIQQAADLDSKQQKNAIKERARLLPDLYDFGCAAGFQTTNSPDSVTLRLGEKHITFDGTPEDGTVQLETCLPESHAFTMRFEHRLNKWVLVIHRKDKPKEQLVFFDTGLEYLIDVGFNVDTETETLDAPKETSETETPTTTRKRTL